jgi:hypothetical protein
MRQGIVSSLAIIAATALFVGAGGPPAGAATRAKPTTLPNTAARQIIDAYRSASGIQVESQLTALLSSPSLRATATALLQSDGPAGANDLTAFQAGMLNALIIGTSNPALLIAKISGRPLSWAERLQEKLLQQQLSHDGAVRTLIQSGSQLKRSSALAGDISAAAAGTVTTYSTLYPPTSVGQGGSADLDSVIDDFASMRTSAAFTDFASQLGPPLGDPQIQGLVTSQPALRVAAFLPVAELVGLHISHGAFTLSALNGIKSAIMDIILPIAGLVISILTLPEEITVLVAAGLVLGVIGTIYSVVNGVDTIANDLDCDHDGDPFDPADMPGQEC